MWKQVWLTMSLLGLIQSSCGGSDPEAKAPPSPANQASGDGLADDGVDLNCDTRYSSRYAARDFGADHATPSLLSVIAWAEGLGNCYHYSFTYQAFTSFAAHPAKIYCAHSLCSSAAGRYQFLLETWNRVATKHSYPSFSPIYQDDGAIALIEEKQVDDFREAYDFPRFKRAMSALGRVWAALPGSPYGQVTRTIEESWQRYQSYLQDP